MHLFVAETQEAAFKPVPLTVDKQDDLLLDDFEVVALSIKLEGFNNNLEASLHQIQDRRQQSLVKAAVSLWGYFQ